MTKIKELEKEIARLKAELADQKELGKEGSNRLLPDPVAALNNTLSLLQTNKSDALVWGKLWSGISHEILTPMDAILGMTDLVMDTELTEEQRGYLEMINASADRLFGVISDIIDYSELVGGKLRQDIVHFDLFQVLEYDLYIAQLSAKLKDLRFTYTFSKDIPSCLTSDPGRLRQVLNNLVSNAIKFTNKGEVQVRVESVGYDDNHRHLVKFTVQDTGMGIPAEVQKTIFQTPTSFRVSGSENKYSEGGLGLVVSAKLVNLFGGEIDLKESDKGKTTFWFTWPMVNPAEAYMGELPPHLTRENRDRSQVLKDSKVLLAEDELINASITKAFLEQAGVDVTVVNDGVEALEVLEKKNFQAILMDVQMPVMDGIEATVAIRKKEKLTGNRHPIIALTAHAMHGDRERCLQAGMDDYLAKPLDRDILTDMLARYMTKKALVVGNEPSNQQETIQPLVEKGWAVTIAETGRLAMYEASLSHFDLIIIDTSMPVDDGVETVKTIRKLEGFSGCRATILGVGATELSDTAGYKEGGVDQFFTRSEIGAGLKKKVAELN